MLPVPAESALLGQAARGAAEEGVQAAEGRREEVPGGRVKQKEKNKQCTPRNKTGEQVERKARL